MSYDVNAVLKIAEAQLGYLQKKSNSNLNDKTNNAGSNNYTKYWEDLKPSYQGQSWCDAFVSWCFLKAYGAEAANELLCGGLYSFYTPTSASYYKNKKQWYTYPKVGDQIFFENDVRICHTGIVIKVTNSYVYTIEGNTSGASGVIPNGGGVCKKSYAIKTKKIAGYGRPNYMAKNSTTQPKETPKEKENTNTLIKFGDTGIDVKTIQTKLIVLGYHCGQDGADGDFGNNTLQAVKAFQKDYNLEVDGIIGEQTKKALNTAYTKKTTSQKTSDLESAQSFNKDIARTYTVSTALNLRAGPSKSKRVITVLPAGAKVQCYGYHTGDWYYITYQGQTGFCMKAYLF